MTARPQPSVGDGVAALVWALVVSIPAAVLAAFAYLEASRGEFATAAVTGLFGIVFVAAGSLWLLRGLHVLAATFGTGD